MVLGVSELLGVKLSLSVGWVGVGWLLEHRTHSWVQVQTGRNLCFWLSGSSCAPGPQGVPDGSGIEVGFEVSPVILGVPELLRSEVVSGFRWVGRVAEHRICSEVQVHIVKNVDMLLLIKMCIINIQSSLFTTSPFPIFCSRILMQLSCYVSSLLGWDFLVLNDYDSL